MVSNNQHDETGNIAKLKEPLLILSGNEEETRTTKGLTGRRPRTNTSSTDTRGEEELSPQVLTLFKEAEEAAKAVATVSAITWGVGIVFLEWSPSYLGSSFAAFCFAAQLGYRLHLLAMEHADTKELLVHFLHPSGMRGGGGMALRIHNLRRAIQTGELQDDFCQAVAFFCGCCACLFGDTHTSEDLVEGCDDLDLMESQTDANIDQELPDGMGVNGRLPASTGQEESVPLAVSGAIRETVNEEITTD